MRINQHTKISELIKANELAIDAIASIAKPLRKIKIPLLRKVLTPRVNIGEASKIAGVSIMEFRRVLEPLGFIWEDTNHSSPLEVQQETGRPDWLKNASSLKALDVRPLLDADKDPLKDIFQAYKALPLHGVLYIINSFIPVPLIKRLEERGALCHTESISDNEYHSYFYKTKEDKKEKSKAQNIAFLTIEEFEEKIMSLTDSKKIEVDVCHLPMPQPMELILHFLSELNNNEYLYVLHRKVPLHLLEELEQSSFQIFICEPVEGDVRLLIFPKE